jgi:predicted N-acetyltransferase YhbS
MLSAETALVRAAHPADAPNIAGVIAAAFEPYRAWLRPASGALSETTGTIAGRLREGHGLVAEAGGRIVGCILIVPKSPAELYVGRLAVLPEWQGRGIASGLMGAAEDLARSQGFAFMSLGVRLALPASRGLFERLGFRFLREERHPGFSEPTYISMRKEL